MDDRVFDDMQRHATTIYRISSQMLARAGILLLTGAMLLGQAAPRAVTLIVTNAIVVTMDADGRVLSPGAVAIDGRDIVAVATPSAIAAG